MRQKTALITGITGQTGSYLTELLLEKGYKVVGMLRRTSTGGYGNISHLVGNKNLILEFGCLTDSNRIYSLLAEYLPENVYNLGGVSFSPDCADKPEYAHNVNALGPVRLLESIHRLRATKRIKFFQASSSEMFGNVSGDYQSHDTRRVPITTYGITKSSAHSSVGFYRNKGVFAVSGILYNHSSPRRKSRFVTRKITKAVAEIKMGLREELPLGNLGSVHDFGHAKDFAEVIWRTLQHKRPQDYTIGTGYRYSVETFCRFAFTEVGLYWADYVTHDPQFSRPQRNIYIADVKRVRKDLGWLPEYNFTQMIAEMVKHDMELLNG